MDGLLRIPELIEKHHRGEKIVALTAYDFSFARLVDSAGAHIVLVGDSLGTVVQGHSTTLPVTLDQMVYHCSMAARGCKRALVVADMPFMTYQISEESALAAAGRLVQEGGASAVKLEGAGRNLGAIRRIVDAGIPVMGHLGLTPQSVHAMGGYRVQGRDEERAGQIIEDAKMLEMAGAFSIVLEGIPAQLAKRVTEQSSIPTIGIGAGPACSGQVLVLHDLLGLGLPEETKLPKFVKQYAAVGEDIVNACRKFIEEVIEGKFPSSEHCYGGDK